MIYLDGAKTKCVVFPLPGGKYMHYLGISTEILDFPENLEGKKGG